MENFIIHDTADFNKYLMELISEDDKEKKSDINDNLCLISNEPLVDNYITMSCGHKFNYIPIINEFINQKKNPNQFEVIRLKNYDLKCPYCRTIQKGTIPYYVSIYKSKIKGINWPPSKMYCNSTCSCIIKSGKRKGQLCGKKCVGKFCTRHNKINNKKAKKIMVKCTQILKSGKRKGMVCGAICKTNECIKHHLCKRHIKFKKNI